jgi:hypothetical protein
LHKGAFKEAEKMLKAPPKGVEPMFCSAVLVEVYLATGRVDDARALYERISWNNTLPWHRDKLTRFTSYFTSVWSPRLHTLHPMEIVTETTTMVGTSICAHPHGLGVLMRSINVKVNGDATLTVTEDRWKRVENTLYWCVLDPTFRTLQSVRVCDRAFYPRATDAFIGYEDPRLVAWRGKVWMSATSYQLYRNGKAHVVLGQIDTDRGDIISVAPLQCPDMNDEQKSWAPWVHGSDLHLVYKVVPWTVLRVDDPKTGTTSVVVQKDVFTWEGTRVSPATSPVPYKGGYLMVVSFTDPDGCVFYRYVRMSNALVPSHYSSTWVLWKPENESIQGLYIHDEYVYISSGHVDQSECRVTRITLPLLDSFIWWYEAI